MPTSQCRRQEQEAQDAQEAADREWKVCEFLIIVYYTL